MISKDLNNTEEILKIIQSKIIELDNKLNTLLSKIELNSNKDNNAINIFINIISIYYIHLIFTIVGSFNKITYYNFFI